MESINFSTHYRPKTFADVVGQDVAVSVLKKIAMADGISVRSVFLKGAFGSGKCVHPDTIVKTRNGLRRASSLKNEEFDIIGEPNRVFLQQKNADKNILNIETECGKHIRVTGNHPVLVWDGSKFDFKEAQFLKPGDCLVEELSKIPYNGGLDKDAYMVGLLLGDGTLTQSKSSSIEFLTTDEWLRDWVVDYCRETYCYYTLSEIAVEGKKLQYRFIFNEYTRLTQLCKSLAILGYTSTTKVLPNNYWEWSFDSQVSLLQGVFDTDGAVNADGSVELGMNAYAVLQGLQHVLSGLGISSRLVKRVREYKRSDGTIGESWRLQLCRWINSCSYEHLCRMPRKKQYLKKECVASQSKRFRFDGMSKEFWKVIENCGLKYPNSDRKRLNTNKRQEFSLQACKTWQEYLNSRGVECAILLKDTAPDHIVSITTEVVDYTIDIQCEGKPIFYTDGVITHNTTLAKIFGKALSCEHFKELGDVCNECDSCKEALAKNSQLYLEFDSSVVGNVESIRDLQQQLAYVPPKGRRLVVFDEIHAASNAAQNAMLKMVEEGIPNTIFLFASTDEIIPTIKSRSICIDISTIPFDLIKKRVQQVADMQNISVDENVLNTIAVKSAGHMRDALSFLQLYSLAGEDGLRSSYKSVCSFFVKAVTRKKDEAEQVLSEIMLYPMVDIKNSIYLFIRNTYISTPESSLYNFLRTGIINKIYGFVFSPVNQMALKDEMGLELVFRSFLDRACNNTK